MQGTPHGPPSAGPRGGAGPSGSGLMLLLSLLAGTQGRSSSSVDCSAVLRLRARGSINAPFAPVNNEQKPTGFDPEQDLTSST